ncbi:bifunctional UDP-N-acetylglucosamine diphosphorylase/glucosamine-1-phosphate N-acetyltransferase GlmU [Synechococcus sp. RSCCF101]|uniref:bifunctional UDP-N-acetylglucosamine diphosphorylase/glucosamine-1-phosphate N-acetyltransferase GlmU n=1 Tax=Synechococcus sp. RSCCF101 TaxID=2511069 RepID=UPI0012443A4A|nr:bifunctional UDP-N-acetylglucosamine diphosphorylase/glucosamine-1-phosphate N-acetyltransferase GlmU [Synechococcus sp. RSCCF101]QEY31457.1 bifunctional UDP-N-acetylglucosamine diphosphorylase/glucosamine-1-phosphate N-acetyltransferase GlmU [Synechococcus sp. RSCCF101]
MLAVAILAAGKGTRMRSDLPKVLQPIAGATLVERVLASCGPLAPERTLLIVGHQAERVRGQLSHRSDLDFVLQQPQNGTGHAVQQLLPALEGFEGDLLVLNGDVPLLRSETLEALVAEHRSGGSAVTLLTAELADPTGYGRVFVDADGVVQAIVEHRDCTDAQRSNPLINAGIYCFHWPRLASVLPLLSSDNDQGELYLTDTVAQLNPARHIVVADADEIAGINDRRQLAACEATLQERLRSHWMTQGVSFIDPASCTLSDGCQLGRDVVIEPQTHLRGACRIGDGCRLGPGTLLENAQLERDVRVLHSVVRDCHLAAGVEVGPFAHIRPGSELGEGCRVGNFVEVKNSRVEPGCKINHLSYIGDSDLGARVNVGAGTITANYDGQRKHRTVIGSACKTGANSTLVAPIRLGDGVTVAAGSTLTEDVPAGSLALGRARQINKADWPGPSSAAAE